MQPLMSHAAENLPGMLGACARFSKLYKRLKPTLMLPGGLHAVLAAAPELAMNMDAWMAANDITELIPFAAQTLLQTGCVPRLPAGLRAIRRVLRWLIQAAPLCSYGHLYETSAASALLYVSPFIMVRRQLQRSAKRSCSCRKRCAD